MDTLAQVKDIATIAGVVIAVVSLVYTAVNSRQTRNATRARFWLDLRAAFERHDGVHRSLRPGGVWASGAAPSNPEEWARLEAYMGLFEHCETMIEQRLLDSGTFKEIYAYRLNNIVANRAIVQAKLVDHANSWRRFLKLLARMGITV